jgi:tRNA(Ile)-lysidine synthase
VIEQLLNHIARHKLCKTSDKILLAVSGGIDSMVMLHLFSKAGFSLGVVHCNFQLRGQDSTLDENFVRDACGTSIPFYSKKFATTDYAASKGISIQMAARELRYKFFEEIRHDQGFAWIATAHHLNDSMETALLNFVKGTGVEGMAGIPEQNGKVIRPLLFATRKTIHDYALANAITWRDDASNRSDDYQRNFLRNNVVPLLKNLNPSLEETFSKTSERLRGASEITQDFIQQLSESSTDAAGLKIQKNALHQAKSPATVLWELIKNFGFNYDQARDIVSEHQAGKMFKSASHFLLVDRDVYLLRKIDYTTTSEIQIPSPEGEVSNGVSRIVVREQSKDGYRIAASASIAQFDLDKVKFPLTWRTWRPGDTFMPFGMRNQKKLSDFLIDMKIPLSEKEQVTLVESDGVIIWVVGFRIHDDYKITEMTKRVLVLEQR